jgi:5-methylcytosine-specific restriction endonuclease McrA
MAIKPEIIKAPWQSQTKATPFGGRSDAGESRKFYQKYSWQVFRKKCKAEQRAHDLTIINEFYAANPSISFSSLQQWLMGDAPLCVHCLTEKQITPATVADHITPIRQGGAKLAKNNIQWLCATHHNIKSAKEAHA